MGRFGLRAAPLALALALGASPAAACLACIEMPRDSLVDHMGAAPVVALLGPAPGDPFRYAPAVVLKGQGVPTPPPPFLLDRQTAAVLDADPTLTVLGTWAPDRGWKRHEIVTPDAVRILMSLQDMDLTSPAARLAAFGPLQGHADAVLDQMALVELTDLPYIDLRRLTPRIDRRRFAGRIADPAWRDWQPSLILLMGLSDDPADRAFVRRAGEAAFRQGARNLSAWATAMIEAGGPEALTWLATSVLADTGRPADDVRAVALALASHAPRTDATGRQAVRMLRDLALANPGLAGLVARSLIESGDWSMAGAMQQMLDRGAIIDPGDLYLVDHYLLAARDSQETN